MTYIGIQENPFLFTPGFCYIFLFRKCQQSKNNVVKVFWLFF